MRPVLMTALTTILGMLPLAIGLNIDLIGLFTNFKPKIYFGGDNVLFWGPMSQAIIFGLVFSTFLTLIIVPVMYQVALFLFGEYLLPEKIWRPSQRHSW